MSNLSKVLYPATGFTKRDVLRYYRDIAPIAVPHVRGRGMTLRRFPNGVASEAFYEKRCPSHRPSWMPCAWIDHVHYCLANDAPSLLWIANLASIELHPLLSVWEDPSRPTQMVFDLDPGPGCDLVDCARLALEVQKDLDSRGLQSFAKTSGSKGMQVYVPLNLPAREPIHFDDTKDFSHRLAVRMERRLGWVVSKMAKSLREEKVFVDWSQNDRSKSTVSVYSLRATERPQVSVPLKWSEVRRLAHSERTDDFVFSPQQALERVRRHGDLFLPVIQSVQRLPAARTRRSA